MVLRATITMARAISCPPLRLLCIKFGLKVSNLSLENAKLGTVTIKRSLAILTLHEFDHVVKLCQNYG